LSVFWVVLYLPIKKETEMNVTDEYSFSAKYTSVDFPRIFKENPNADFIRVAWKDEKNHQHVIFFATEKGYERLHKAEMTHYTESLRHTELTAQGSFHCVTLGYEGYLLTNLTYGCRHPLSDEDFGNFYALLRQREARRHEICVAAIN
jgi:hypothetical protein